MVISGVKLAGQQDTVSPLLLEQERAVEIFAFSIKKFTLHIEMAFYRGKKTVSLQKNSSWIESLVLPLTGWIALPFP